MQMLQLLLGKCYSQKNMYDLSEDVKTVGSISKSAFLFQRDELPFSGKYCKQLGAESISW